MRTGSTSGEKADTARRSRRVAAAGAQERALRARGAPAAGSSYHGVMRFPRLVLVFLALSWVLVILYPDPGVLGRSVRNTLRPRVEPQAAAALARSLPDDPRAIEAYVLGTQVPYAYDWRSAGVPWYFPTASEALRAGRGDCESRALVLASLLTAKGIPNELRLSFDHIWVDYPGKQANALENAGVQFAGRQDGRFFLHWPADFHLGQEVADQVAIFWTPAPWGRVLLLALGLTVIPLWNVLAALFAGNGLAAPGSWAGAAGKAKGAPGRLRRRPRQATPATRPQRV